MTELAHRVILTHGVRIRSVISGQDCSTPAGESLITSLFQSAFPAIS